MLVLTKSFIIDMIGSRGKFSKSNAAILILLIPAYSTWMVALGFNLMLSRLSFAMGRPRLFTLPTLFGYFIANIVRVSVWIFTHAFALSIIFGALVELLVSVAVMIAVAFKGAAFRSSALSDINPTPAPSAADGFVGS